FRSAAASPRGGGRPAPAPAPVVLPAGMINPSVPIRNIRMKFAVLIGLIQVGEVSNRDIVETVLNLTSGSPGLLLLPHSDRPWCRSPAMTTLPLEPKFPRATEM
uniref:Neurobeachin n=1 Tax=Castor canadensis TaxID=51338 RepID=A0A8C0W6V2_CASCN